MSITIEDLAKRVTALEEKVTEARVIRMGRPPVIGECKFGAAPGECTKASVYQYQHGCRGGDCSDKNAAYYAEHRDKKKAANGTKPKPVAKAAPAKAEKAPAKQPVKKPAAPKAKPAAAKAAAKPVKTAAVKKSPAEKQPVEKPVAEKTRRIARKSA